MQNLIISSLFVSFRFVVSSVELSDKAEPVIHYIGLSTEAVASGLKAFTQYSVTLEVGMPRCHVQYFYLFKFGHNLAVVSPKIKIKFCSNLQACSSGGCTSSPPLYFLTAAAPPQNQSAPNITATGPHTLHASWEPPSQPNGILPCAYTPSFCAYIVLSSFIFFYTIQNNPKHSLSM